MKTHESYDRRCHCYRQPVKAESEHVRSVIRQPLIDIESLLLEHSMTYGKCVLGEEASDSSYAARKASHRYIERERALYPGTLDKEMAEVLLICYSQDILGLADTRKVGRLPERRPLSTSLVSTSF